MSRREKENTLDNERGQETKKNHPPERITLRDWDLQSKQQKSEPLTQAALSISLVVKLGEGSSNCGKRPSLLQFLGARLPQ